MASPPFPNLKVHPQSGLTFPWAFYNPNIVSDFEARFGPDGSSIGEVMLIRWQDLPDAVKQLIGYSWRDTSSTTPNGNYWLRRKLPWQHPYANQLVVKSINSVKGLENAGTNFNGIDEGSFGGDWGTSGWGTGYTVNAGPWSVYEFAMLTLSFWRPPYYIRTDADIIDQDGNPQEWLRWVDKDWDFNTQMLSREGSQFVFSSGQGLDGKYFQGSVGQSVTHSKVIRRWYEVPEAALFQALTDATLNGLPYNMLYTQTQTTNPITGYVYPVGSPIQFCVNSPFGGGTDDSNVAKRFFGAIMGTLRFEYAKLKPRPLQLPPFLMQIPLFSNNEAISQQQYDVEFYFDLFDPPRVPSNVVNSVFALALDTAGSGYSGNVSYALSFSGGGGAGAQGYAYAPAEGGPISALVLTNGGSGYTSAPTVTIPAPGGGGTQATGHALILTGSPPAAYRGHNLMPFSGNGFWFAVQSQMGPVTTPFQYADLRDLFRIL